MEDWEEVRTGQPSYARELWFRVSLMLVRDKTSEPPRRDPSLFTGATRLGFLALFVFSLFTNVLALTGVVFTLQVYDRVLAGRSLETLTVLFLMAAALFVAQGMLTTVRQRLSDRVGQRILLANEAQMLSETAERFSRGMQSQGPSPVKDLETVVLAIRGRALNAVFDAPWSCIFLVTLWAMEPLMGLCALLSAGMLIVVALVVSVLRSRPAPETDDAVAQRAWEAALKDFRGPVAAATRSLGDSVAQARRALRDANKDNRETRQTATGWAGALRQISQIAVLAVGAWLVISGQATMGIMMASTILMGRIFAPLEAILVERGAVADALGAWRRLRGMRRSRSRAAMVLYRTRLGRVLRADRLGVAPTRTSERTINNVGFVVEPGQLLVVTGGTSFGKSLLLRTLAGLHQPSYGVLCLGDIPYSSIGSEVLEQIIGYLPQENALLPGSIADAIARYDRSVSLEHVVEAAKQAELHDRILALRDGYQSRLPPEGTPLAFGFARRLGLARAICRRPQLLLLDDPLAGFDAATTKVVVGIIERQRAGGGLCIVATNPPAFLDVADNVLVLGEGKVAAYGPPAVVFRPRPVRSAKPAEKIGGDHGS
jgi:ATP-binding cassette, subfamily C, type I secretion system permease/ATPase